MKKSSCSNLYIQSHFFISLLLIFFMLSSPLVILAQTPDNLINTNDTTEKTPTPAENGGYPTVIGSGVDTASNQVYLVWDEPITKQYKNLPIDGFTLFVNNVQRKILHNGAEIGNLFVETY